MAEIGGTASADVRGRLILDQGDIDFHEGKRSLDRPVEQKSASLHVGKRML